LAYIIHNTQNIWNSCNKRWQSYRSVYFLLDRQQTRSRTSELVHVLNAVTLKIKQLQVEGDICLGGP